MKNELVLLNKNNPVTTSEIIAEGTKKSHKSIMELIRRYESDLNEFGTSAFETRKSGGRPTEFYYLNEQHVTFLITLMRNTPTVVKFKKELIKQFWKMHKWILDQKTMKTNEEYKLSRGKSILGRKQETDIIKEFIEYAKSQGSQSADKYYMIFSKMENSAFFILKEKFKNVREILSIDQLSKIIIADMIVKQAIIEGMQQKLFYKDIFQLAKKRVIELSNSLGFKEVLPGIKFIQLENKEEKP